MNKITIDAQGRVWRDVTGQDIGRLAFPDGVRPLPTYVFWQGSYWPAKE
jgi:hypothetical protein